MPGIARLWLAVVLSVLLLLLFAGFTGRDALDTLLIDLRYRAVALVDSQSAAGSTTTHASSASGPRVGANVFLEQEVEPAKRELSLELLRAAGVSLIRQELPWEQIEPVEKGTYVDPYFGGSTWTKFDDIVDQANAQDMDLLFRLDTSPRWALPTGSPDGLGPPIRDSDFWDFVSAVATRYRGRVRAYQIWNEPNLTSEWGGQSPDPAAYARLLQGAAQRIRAADPNALVVMAALAPTLTQSADAQGDLTYLQALYDQGVRGYYDVLAVQAYGLRGGPDDPRTGNEDVTFSRPQLIRQLMLNNGDGATPVWATEFGWDANPPELDVQRFGRVTPMLQARYTARALQHITDQWPWMQTAIIWYWKRADERDRGEDWYWFRLADPSFQLQPVYFALRDRAAELGRLP